MAKDKEQALTATEEIAPAIHVAPSPHLSSTSTSTKQMMLDVLIALAPVVGMAIYVFQMYAVRQLAICVSTCLVAEALFTRMRGKDLSLGDFSAAVTGVILALSLPGTAPWFVGVIASIVAVGIGKIIFGGVGMNIFNPAMVGRAFVMISFATFLGASGYQDIGSAVDAITQATPMDAFKQGGVVVSLPALFWGLTNGSLGETQRPGMPRRRDLSLCPADRLLGDPGRGHRGRRGHRRHRQPSPARFRVDGAPPPPGRFASCSAHFSLRPIRSPVRSLPRGKLIFGIGVGAFIMLLRIFSGYPEGVMFAVLLMNGVTPLINRWTIPRPLGAK